jgi:hypothetical protein
MTLWTGKDGCIAGMTTTQHEPLVDISVVAEGDRIARNDQSDMVAGLAADDAVLRNDDTMCMQDIGTASTRTPIVYRPAGTDTVYLTFEGLRESPTVADERTRVRITLPAQEAVHFWQQLANDVPADAWGAPTQAKRSTPPR